jgi:hypothetical protein
VNRPTARTLLIAAAGLLASGALAAPAQATLSISSFSLAPSTTQAGGTTTTPGPNLNLTASFGTTNGDSPDDLQLSLAPGLLANPTVVPLCSDANFEADNCSSSSQIGSGTVTGTAPEFGTTLALPATAYLVAPAGSEVADIGLIVTFFDYPVATQTGPVKVRSTPNVGINIPLDGLPDEIEGVPVQLTGLNLTLAGAIGGQPFTRNPTSCSSATSTITVNSYDAQSTNETASSSFTPTGCGSLPYSPNVTGTVTKDSSDSAIGMTATITSSYNQADSQSIELSFPFSASPNLGTLLSAECTPSTTAANPWSGCTSVGSASITTPLLSSALTAPIYLQEHTDSLPTLEIVIPQPFGITLTATPVLTGSSVQALVANVPDIPITKLTMTLPGGANSLFLGGVHLCSQSQSFGGSFTAWSGATATPSSTATVTGCPSSSSSTANPLTSTPSTAPAATLKNSASVVSGSSPATAAGSSGAVSYTGLSGPRPRVVVAVGGGTDAASIQSVTLRLPAGFAIASQRLPRGIRLAVDGRFVASTERAGQGTLTLTFARAGKVAMILLAAPSLSVSKAVRADHSGRLTVTATLRRIGGGVTTLRLSPRER